MKNYVNTGHSAGMSFFCKIMNKLKIIEKNDCNIEKNMIEYMLCKYVLMNLDKLRRKTSLWQ